MRRCYLKHLLPRSGFVLRPAPAIERLGLNFQEGSKPALTASCRAIVGFLPVGEIQTGHLPETNGLTPSESTRLAPMFFIRSLRMEQGSLFPDPRTTVTDEELVAVFRGAIARRGRLSRLADLYLNTVCAEHLVHELRVAGMQVVRAAPERLRE